MTAKILLAAIRGYQLVFSPFFGGWCRFQPSCSVYASEAIRMHGARRGSWLAIKRLAKCHPFGAHGVDPVPSVTSLGHRTSEIGRRI
jgi:uncharacterized protein